MKLEHLDSCQCAECTYTEPVIDAIEWKRKNGSYYMASFLTYENGKWGVYYLVLHDRNRSRNMWQKGIMRLDLWNRAIRMISEKVYK